MNDLKNIQLCGCCRRIMPAFSKGLFCPECLKVLNDVKKNGTTTKIGDTNGK